VTQRDARLHTHQSRGAVCPVELESGGTQPLLVVVLATGRGKRRSERARRW